MLMKNFLKNRESTRDFRKRKADKPVLDEIRYHMKDIERKHDEGSFSFKLHEDGEAIAKGLDGLAGYHGVMIESPHYISLKTSDEREELIYGAYALEKMTTELHKLSMGSCWITLENVDEDVKAKVLGEDQRESIYMLAIGYPKLQNPFAKKVTSDRKSIDEIVYMDKIGKKADLDELENLGLLETFYYVRYAPSTKNLQPWKFLVKDHSVILLLEEDNQYLADIGIAMYYFEVLANIGGIRNTWEFLDGRMEDGYIYVAKYIY